MSEVHYTRERGMLDLAGTSHYLECVSESVGALNPKPSTLKHCFTRLGRPNHGFIVTLNPRP